MYNSSPGRFSHGNLYVTAGVRFGGQTQVSKLCSIECADEKKTDPTMGANTNMRTKYGVYCSSNALPKNRAPGLAFAAVLYTLTTEFDLTRLRGSCQRWFLFSCFNQENKREYNENQLPVES